MFCAALARTVYLTTLAISVPAQSINLLKQFMLRAGFYSRMPPKIHLGSENATTTPCIPELHSFCSNSVHLLDIVQYRNLRGMCLSAPMGYDDLNLFFNTLIGHGVAPPLEDLRIRIQTNIDIHATISTIGKVFPTIITLSVEQNAMDVFVCTRSTDPDCISSLKSHHQALLRMLMKHTETLGALRHLFLNFRAKRIPPHGSHDQDSIAYQFDLLERMSFSTHRPLCLVRIGPCLWRTIFGGTGWTPMPTHYTILWWIDTFATKTLFGQPSGMENVAKMMLLNWKQ
jgi:hypothetical protein